MNILNLTNTLSAEKFKTRQTIESLTAGIFAPVEIGLRDCKPVIIRDGYGVEVGNKQIASVNTSPIYFDRRKPTVSVLVETIAVSNNDGLTSTLMETFMSNQTPVIFNDTEITITDHNGQQWLTSSEVAKALGYKHENSVSKLYDRNKEEFDDSMTLIVKLTINDKKYATRIFSKRGCHLIGMFAKTDTARQFRVWVLNHLDGKTGQGTPIENEAPRITPQQLGLLKLTIHNIAEPFHFKNRVTNRINNTLRYTLNIGNVSDIHPDDHHKAQAIVERAKTIASAYQDALIGLEHEFINDIMGYGLEFTPALRAKYRKDLRLKLPTNPNWEQVKEELNQLQLENKG